MYVCARSLYRITRLVLGLCAQALGLRLLRLHAAAVGPVPRPPSLDGVAHRPHRVLRGTRSHPRNPSIWPPHHQCSVSGNGSQSAHKVPHIARHHVSISAQVQLIHKPNNRPTLAKMCGWHLLQALGSSGVDVALLRISTRRLTGITNSPPASPSPFSPLASSSREQEVCSKSKSSRRCRAFSSTSWTSSTVGGGSTAACATSRLSGSTSMSVSSRSCTVIGKRYRISGWIDK